MKEMIESLRINKSKTKYHKSAFDKTSEDRQQKVLEVAIAEFAANGYNATNINTIARKAGISIGSLYSYFESKEALFLTVVDKGYNLLERALREIDFEKGDIFEVFERLLRASRHYAVNFPELNQIYLDVTTQGLSSLSSKLSRQMESITAELYCSVIKKAKEKGTIAPGTDEQLVSFYLDNLIVMFQFSFTSDYYKERMKIFLGPEAMEDEERIIQGFIGFIRKALSG